MNLKEYIRDIPDFPKKGILFHDVTTLFKSPEAFAYVMNTLASWYKDEQVDYVLGIEARGFIIGGSLANLLGCGFVPVRKPGKLPAEVITEEYQLEYGTDKVELHKDALQAGDRVLIVDDLVATGGTLLAGIKLAKKLHAEIVGVASVIDMPDLGGREKLKSHNYRYLVEYRGH
ncbi:adenine phosphoribosyltransferase [Bacteroidota bacterium]